MRLVIIGAPGAGKGTQSSKICEVLKIPHLSTGDIFRFNIKNETELGIKVKEIINQGNLVSDDITMDIIQDRLSKDDCQHGFLMDGFPRTVKQAQFLEKLLQTRNINIDRVINLVVEDSEILERMTGRRVCTDCGASYHQIAIPPKKEGICDKCDSKLIQREDDMMETVLQRLEVYHAQTKPIIDFYDDRGLLINILGNSTAEDTSREIFTNLGVMDASNKK
jgi:adenylate kinase